MSKNIVGDLTTLYNFMKGAALFPLSPKTRSGTNRVAADIQGNGRDCFLAKLISDMTHMRDNRAFCEDFHCFELASTVELSGHVMCCLLLVGRASRLHVPGLKWRLPPLQFKPSETHLHAQVDGRTHAPLPARNSHGRSPA